VSCRESGERVLSADLQLAADVGAMCIDRFLSDAHLLWARHTIGDLRGQAIAVDAAGNSYVVGDLLGTVTFGLGEATQTTLVGHSIFVRDFFVAKYGANGAFLWARSTGGHGSDQGMAIAADAAGNVHVTGMFDGAVTFGPGETSEASFTADFGDMFP